MKPILIHDEASQDIAKKIAKLLACEQKSFVHRYFPDGETLVRVPAMTGHKEVILVLRLDRPDAKLFPLLLAASAMRKQGVKKITLVAPYLPYMRQDKAFHPGEAIGAQVFAKVISQCVDELITIDPHLHRIHQLSEIYAIPTKTLSAAPILANYIAKNITRPLLIGPDAESVQWVTGVAREKELDYVVLKKKRYSDTKVRIVWDDKIPVKGRTAVLVDDIISSGGTMIEVVKQLRTAGFKQIACLAVHAVFAGEAFQKIKKAGATHIATCHSIRHESNKMDVSFLLAGALT